MSDKEKDPQEKPSQAQSQRHGSAPETPASTAGVRPAGPDASTDVEARLEALASEVTRLSEALRGQKMAFQDVEVSLVSRIGDVDDDRRQAATRLQRTLQAQRDEVDERLRRQSSLITVILLVFLLLVGGALTFVYYQVGGMRQSLAAQVSEIGKAVDQLEMTEPVTETDPVASERLTQLSEAVEEITTSLERLSEEAEPAAPAAAPASSAAPAEPIAAKAPGAPAAEPGAQSATDSAGPERAPDDDMPAREPAEPAETAQLQAEIEMSDVETSKPSTPAPSTSEPAAADDDEAQDPEGPPAAQAPQPRLDEASGDTAEKETAEAAEPQEQPAEAITTEEAPADQPQALEATEPRTQDAAQPSAGRIQLGDQNVTLQLLGFYSLDEMERFIAEHELPSTLYYQTTIYRGRPWYVLIHSLHASQEAAEEAAGTLPPDLAKLQIWIRQLDPEDEVTLVRPPSD
ncbi:SPOR domain-containing protein [Thiorhodococcus minor]|uniref:SPOR domain-containing protein n=1 Tax=Thiorhodococcus minor TaxID=57489 RepID=A0A6M0JVE2_9GAMM|nr:hypothetical protein [Thiorhodococcus minor]NEV60871.1 hypothetical protein [Thiorhodococcus minor]